MQHDSEMIDLHIHGIEGLDTRKTEPEAIARIAEIEGKAGVSEILLSVYSGPIEVMRQQMETVRQAINRQEESFSVEHILREGSRVEARELPARILGVHLEGPFLNPHAGGALDSSSFLDPTARAFEQLVEGFEDIVRAVTIAPEKNGSINLIRSMAKAGILVNMGHSTATFQEAAAGLRAGARGITHLFNAMRGFHHREPGLSGFGLLNADIYVEVIGDMEHLGREALELVFRMKRADRIVLVSDSIRETSRSDSQARRGGGESLLGGSATLPDAVQRLINEGFDEERVIQAASANPKAFLLSA
jgi:N-acetylglucosamine-6-phosphate deacetylase